MPEKLVKFNKKIDAWSKTMTNNISSIWGQKIPKISGRKKTEMVGFLCNYSDNYLEKHGKKIITILNSLFHAKHQLKDFGFFINATNFSLHNTEKNYISIGTNHSFSSYPTIIIHELFHIYFYEFIKKDNINLENKDLNEFKEILTIIINDVFRKFIYTPDEGYPDHKKIRHRLSIEWERNKNFNIFIKKAIILYKK